MDIAEIISAAKLGGERKAAQIDTCGPFAVALYDVLTEAGEAVSIKTVSYFTAGSSQPEWHHAVVEHHGRYYDSLGEFTLERVRKQTRIHHTVSSHFHVRDDDRDCCYEEELHELHEFLVRALRRSTLRVTQKGAPNNERSQRPKAG